MEDLGGWTWSPEPSRLARVVPSWWPGESTLPLPADHAKGSPGTDDLQMICVFPPKNSHVFPHGFKPETKVQIQCGLSTFPAAGRKGYDPKCCRACLKDAGWDWVGCAWDWIMEKGYEDQGGRNIRMGREEFIDNAILLWLRNQQPGNGSQSWSYTLLEWLLEAQNKDDPQLVRWRCWNSLVWHWRRVNIL